MANASGSRISSPASTGGAGNIFERHVAAYWLAQLLVRSIPPIFLESSVVEVSFQTERLGWNTDDFLIVCEQAGEQRKLAGQVKRRFTMSSSDEECVKAVTDFWLDYKNGAIFNPAYDCFILVTLRGTNVLLEHFVGILDCARACSTSTEFEGRLQTPGLLRQTAITYYQELLTIIGKVEGRPMGPPDLWAFLRVLHLLSLDLNTSTSQTEANIVSLLAHTVSDGDGMAAATSSWAALLKLADKAYPIPKRCAGNTCLKTFAIVMAQSEVANEKFSPH